MSDFRKSMEFYMFYLKKKNVMHQNVKKPTSVEYLQLDQ